MLVANNIFVKYGDRVLLDHINFKLGVKDKVGLIGRNGVGKSTLLGILSQENAPTSGNVEQPKGTRIGYLKQHISINQELSIKDAAAEAFSDVLAAQAELDEIGHKLENSLYESDEAQMAAIEKIEELSIRVEVAGANSMEGTIEKVLKGLGFTNAEFSKKVGELSGGWQMRIELAKMLLQSPEFLFLDEPTNYLDIVSIIWLENYLRNYPKAIILISHDQEFIQNVCTRIVEIDQGKLFDFKGSFNKYQVHKAEQQEIMMNAYKNQQRMLAQKEMLVDKFKAKASKAKFAKSLQKEIDRTERIEVYSYDSSALKIQWPKVERSGEVAVLSEGLCKHYGEKQVFNDIDYKILRGEKIALVGKNGTGKSTFVKLVTKDIEATKGGVDTGHNVVIGYYAQNQADLLDRNKSVLETMEDNATEENRSKVRNILGSFMFSGEDAEKKVSVLSGGEKARLCLAVMTLRPFNLMILDEPTNHLDINAKDVIKNALLKFEGTLIVVSHDREFLKGLTDKTVEFRDRSTKEYLGDVEYYLETVGIESIREIETTGKKKGTPKMSTATNQTPDKAPKSKKRDLSFDEAKKLKRAVSNAEKKIERCENRISEIEVLMADPKYYMSPDQAKTDQEYARLKNDLKQAYETWEKASAEME